MMPLMFSGLRDPVQRALRNAVIGFAGNSLVAGVGATVALPAQLDALPPINGSLAVTNFGSSGITTPDMNTYEGASVDATFVAGKTNILFVWEGTNDIYLNGYSWAPQTGAAAAANMTTYIGNRKAATAGLKVILLNCLPRTSDTALNTRLTDYNTILASSYVSMGADALVDVRPTGGPFSFTDYSAGSFDSGHWYDNVHLNDAGYAVVAQWCATALTALLSA